MQNTIKFEVHVWLHRCYTIKIISPYLQDNFPLAGSVVDHDRTGSLTVSRERDVIIVELINNLIRNLVKVGVEYSGRPLDELGKGLYLQVVSNGVIRHVSM